MTVPPTTPSGLLSTFEDRITVIRQANRGVSAARNAGIRAATGELIALLDSDDTWLPGKVTAQVSFFSTHPDALVCQTQEIWVRNGVRVNPGKRHRKQAGMIFERSLALCLVSPSAVMMRRSLLDDVGLFDEALPACEDYDLWLRIAWKHPIHLIDRPLIVKRRRSRGSAIAHARAGQIPDSVHRPTAEQRRPVSRSG